MKLNEKEQRFLRMFPPRMKQLENQIRLVKNCSRKMAMSGVSQI